AAREELDLSAAHEVGEVTDDVGTVALEPVEQGSGKVEACFHFGMPVQRGNKRRICALGHVGEDIREVPGGLVLVENQRQSQAIGHSKVILPQTPLRHTFRTVTVRSAGSIVGDVDTKDAAGRFYLQMSDRRRLRVGLLAVTCP